MTRFVDLIESGRKEPNAFDGAGMSRAVVALYKRCRAREGLEAEGVWRLARREVLELQRETDYRPPGGWRALCALAVGTGVLKARDDGFVTGPVDPEEWSEDDGIRSRLLESFTRWLIPPSTAAGLFLAMGVHPLWGLRLARRLHVDAPTIEEPAEGWRDEKLLPEEDLEALRKGVFAALSVVASGLRRLEDDRRYGLEALTGFVGEAIDFGRDRIETTGEGLEVLIEDVGEPQKARARSTEFAARELFDGVLVPAGVMRRYDDETFGVDPGVWRDVRVGHLGTDAQRTWFQCFLVEEDSSLVA